MIAMTLSPFWCLYPENPMPSPFFCHGVGSVAMEHAEIELFLCREMPHTGHKRLPERPVSGPFGTGRCFKAVDLVSSVEDECHQFCGRDHDDPSAALSILSRD